MHHFVLHLAREESDGGLAVSRFLEFLRRESLFESDIIFRILSPSNYFLGICSGSLYLYL